MFCKPIVGSSLVSLLPLSFIFYSCSQILFFMSLAFFQHLSHVYLKPYCLAFQVWPFQSQFLYIYVCMCVCLSVCMCVEPNMQLEITTLRLRVRGSSSSNLLGLNFELAVFLLICSGPSEIWSFNKHVCVYVSFLFGDTTLPFLVPRWTFLSLWNGLSAQLYFSCWHDVKSFYSVWEHGMPLPHWYLFKCPIRKLFSFYKMNFISYFDLFLVHFAVS